MTTGTLYKTDFYAWAQAQAVLLREEELADLDLPNLAEELEAMGRRERRELLFDSSTIRRLSFLQIARPGATL